MHRVCEICGTEYGSDAEYCNLCKKESLIAVETEPEPEPPRPPLIDDPQTLWFVAVLWLLGLGYLLAQVRPREWLDLLAGWGCLAALTWAACFAMRNARMAVVFSLLGLLFCAIYGLLVL